MDHPEDPFLPFYERYFKPLFRADSEAARAQAAQELGRYLVDEYWVPAQREQFSRGLAALAVYHTDALIDALVAFLETRKDLPVEWPEEDPYEEGMPLPDRQGEAAVLVLKMIQSQRHTPRMYMLSQRAVPALLKVLDEGYQWNVDEAAIGALGESGDERAIGPLLERLNLGDHRAAKALGQLKAIDGLLTALASHREDVRRAAIGALGQYGGDWPREIPRGWTGEYPPRGWILRADDSVFDPLLACLKDPMPTVRRAAQEALGELRDPRAIEPLIACLSASDAWTRQKVPEALSKFWDRRSVEALLTCVHDADPFVRKEAIVALGKLEELQAIAPIQDCLQDNSQQVRQVAAQVLKQLQDLREKAIGRLLANLQSTSAIARRNAARALAEYKDDPRVIGAWLACLENKNPVEPESLWHGLELDDEASDDDVLGVVASELCLLGPQLALVEPRAFDHLQALAQNKHGFARRPHAIRVLGALGDPRTVDPLMDVLQEQDLSSIMIGATADALGRLKDTRAVEPLTHVLERAQPGEIWSNDFGSVTWALEKLKDRRAIEPLIARLRRSDSFPKERWHIIEALEKLGATEAIEPLIACLQDTSILVREASARALGTLGDVRAFTPLTMALHDPAERVRQQAQVALQKLSTAQQ